MPSFQIYHLINVWRKKIFKKWYFGRKNSKSLLIVFNHTIIFSLVLELKRSILKHLMTSAFTLRFPICSHTAHLDFHVGDSYKNYFKMYSFYK